MLNSYENHMISRLHNTIKTSTTEFNRMIFPINNPKFSKQIVTFIIVICNLRCHMIPLWPISISYIANTLPRQTPKILHTFFTKMHDIFLTYRI